MAEDNNYDPGDWRGHDFGAAKASYASTAAASVRAASVAHVPVSSLIPDRLVSQSTSPLVVMCDVTGSMGTWPKTIFSKLPYLDIEGRTYLGPDMEISFAANGDLHDQWPLQVQEFGEGTALKDNLGKLLIEGGGGGPVGGQEAYEMGALYYARNVDFPNAVKPIFIFIADEQPHVSVSKSNAAQYKVSIEGGYIQTDAIFAELKTRYSVYLVHKSYSPQSRAEWVRLLGEDHIVDLEDPERVVDVIFGILARETNQVSYFKTEIEGRQTPAQVKTVYKALETVHRNLPAVVNGKGKSTMHKPSGGKPTQSLI